MYSYFILKIEIEEEHSVIEWTNLFGEEKWRKFDSMHHDLDSTVVSEYMYLRCISSAKVPQHEFHVLQQAKSKVLPSASE